MNVEQIVLVFTRLLVIFLQVNSYIVIVSGLNMSNAFNVTVDSFISVRILSVLRGHSVFSSPPQWPMTSDFERFLYQILYITLFSYQRISIPDLIHYIIFLFQFLRKGQYFSFSMLCAKQGNYWYHFYNVFCMTRSLTGD